MWVFKIVLLVILLAGGCPVALSAEAVMADSVYDQYAKTTGIATIKYSVPDIGSFFAPAFAFAHLAGNVSDKGQEAMWMHIYYHSGSWKFFDRAQDIEGNNLVVNVADRRVETGSSLVEEFSVQLSRDYIERHSDAGFDIRFLGKYGQLIVKFPADHVRPFLATLTKVEASVREKIRQSQMEVPPMSSAAVGTNQRPKLGIKYSPITSDFLKVAHLDNVDGVVVLVVEPGSIAEKAGLLPGDAIESINKIKLKSDFESLPKILNPVAVGNVVPFSIWRNAKKIEIPVGF